uniref:Uncharacterized protein n=1 Tax=Alexandrium monilatum TaxID=311494 RepID=A0A7S4VTU9_9DINO
MRWPATLLGSLLAASAVVLAYRPEFFGDTADDPSLGRAQQLASLGQEALENGSVPNGPDGALVGARSTAEHQSGQPRFLHQHDEEEPAEERGAMTAVQVLNSAHMRWASHGPQHGSASRSYAHQHHHRRRHHHTELAQGAHHDDIGGEGGATQKSVSALDHRGRVVDRDSDLNQGHAGAVSEASEAQGLRQASNGSAARAGGEVAPPGSERHATQRQVKAERGISAAVAAAAGPAGANAAVLPLAVVPPLHGPTAALLPSGGNASQGPNRSRAALAGRAAQNASAVNSSGNRATMGLEDVAALEAHNSMEHIADSLERRDLKAVRSYLVAVGRMLEHNPTAFDPNAMVPVPRDGTVGAAPAGGGGGAAADGQGPRAVPPRDVGDATLLALAARSGWLPGVEELIEWDEKRRDYGRRLDLDEGGKTGPYAASPLLLAIQAGHVGVAGYLVQHGASVAVRDLKGQTPLEIAAHSGSQELTAVLLQPESMLSHGLISLQLRLRKDAETLPRLEGGWPESASLPRVQLARMHDLVPPAFRPTPEELHIVGNSPMSWVILYRIKVMCAFADGVLTRGRPSHGTEVMLVEHGFESFARGFSLSCVILAGMLGFFGLLTYIAFRIRLYGWCETPVSLVDFIPGAFDPARLAAPDFDPSRQKARLPYLTAKEYLGPQASSCWLFLGTFMQALMGVFSSWLLQFVRIPPERDPYDEDYMSDDDEESRAKVREACMVRAYRVRRVEVTARVIGFVAIMLWLLLGAQRWGEAAMLSLLYFYHAWVASSVAGSIVPAPPVEPEKTPDDPNSEREEAPDAARVVHALFSVQHGPRWTRAVCSTRSTAAPTNSAKTRLLRRRQRRHQQAHSSNLDADRPGSEAGPSKEGGTSASAGATMPAVSEVDETAFSDWFQRTLLQSGSLHISHGALLGNSLVSICLVAFLIVWLAHGRRLLFGDWFHHYAWISPTILLQVYGAPGTPMRCMATVLELLLLWFIGERVYGIVSLLHVALLTLEQRKAALLFARRHQPMICKKDPDEPVSVRGVMIALEECIRCFDHALELSAVRWVVLREPTLLVYVCSLKFLVASLLLMALPFAGASGSSFLGNFSTLDPMVPLCLSLCLAWPLLGLLFAGATANREVAQQREHIRTVTDAAMTLAAAHSKEADDVEFVQLRVRSREALQHCFLRWPGGRLMGLAEPVLLLCLMAATFSLTLSGGAGLESQS